VDSDIFDCPDSIRQIFDSSVYEKSNSELPEMKSTEGMKEELILFEAQFLISEHENVSGERFDGI
jgi:hypothetical protein